METFKINYAPKGWIKYLPFILSLYAVIFGSGLAIMEVMAKNYSVIFYSSILLVLLGVIVLLFLIFYKPLPILVFTLKSLQVQVSDKAFAEYEWNDVKEVGIGISSLKLITLDEKAHDLDLSEIKYKDLRVLKSKIIELCENRNIPYKNDY